MQFQTKGKVDIQTIKQHFSHNYYVLSNSQHILHQSW